MDAPVVRPRERSAGRRTPELGSWEETPSWRSALSPNGQGTSVGRVEATSNCSASGLEVPDRIATRQDFGIRAADGRGRSAIGNAVSKSFVAGARRTSRKDGRAGEWGLSHW